MNNDSTLKEVCDSSSLLDHIGKLGPGHNGLFRAGRSLAGLLGQEAQHHPLVRSSSLIKLSKVRQGALYGSQAALGPAATGQIGQIMHSFRRIRASTPTYWRMRVSTDCLKFIYSCCLVLSRLHFTWQGQLCLSIGPHTAPADLIGSPNRSTAQ